MARNTQKFFSSLIRQEELMETRDLCKEYPVEVPNHREFRVKPFRVNRLESGLTPSSHTELDSPPLIH